MDPTRGAYLRRLSKSGNRFDLSVSDKSPSHSPSSRAQNFQISGFWADASRLEHCVAPTIDGGGMVDAEKQRSIKRASPNLRSGRNPDAEPRKYPQSAGSRIRAIAESEGGRRHSGDALEDAGGDGAQPKSPRAE